MVLQVYEDGVLCCFFFLFSKGFFGVSYCVIYDVFDGLFFNILEAKKMGFSFRWAMNFDVNSAN